MKNGSIIFEQTNEFFKEFIPSGLFERLFHVARSTHYIAERRFPIISPKNFDIVSCEHNRFLGVILVALLFHHVKLQNYLLRDILQAEAGPYVGMVLSINVPIFLCKQMERDSNMANTQGNVAMGTVECNTCQQKKPFQDVRWSKDLASFVCTTCMSSVEQIPQSQHSVHKKT